MASKVKYTNNATIVGEDFLFSTATSGGTVSKLTSGDNVGIQFASGGFRATASGTKLTLTGTGLDGKAFKVILAAGATTGVATTLAFTDGSLGLSYSKVGGYRIADVAVTRTPVQLSSLATRVDTANKYADIVADGSGPTAVARSFTLTANADRFTGDNKDDAISGSAADLQATDTLNGGAGNDAMVLTGATALTDAQFAGVRSVEILSAQGNVTLGSLAAASGLNRLNLSGTAEQVVDLSGSDATMTVIGSTLSKSDTVKIDLAKAGQKSADLGGGADQVSVSGVTGQVRLSFTSANVGNGSGLDAAALGAGLAVRMQVEGAADALPVGGVVHRFDDEGIVFKGASFDVRDFVTGAARGVFTTVQLGTAAIDNLVAEADGAYLNGGGGNDVITGLGGDDALVGGAGDDLLVGGGGKDLFIGGAGADTLRETNADSTIDGGDGTDTLVVSGNLAPVSDAVFEGIEVIQVETAEPVTLDLSRQLGEAFNITLGQGAGDVSLADGNDKVTGGAGNDTLRGGAGNDTLDGGAGDDVFVAVTSGDVITGGDGFDTLTVVSSFAPAALNGIERVIVDESATGPLLIDLSKQTAGAGIEAALGVGGGTLIGSSGSDVLQGAAGADSITAGAGDVVDAGAGNDVINYVEGTANTAAVSFDGGEGTDRLVVRNSLTAAFAGLVGIERIELVNASTTVPLVFNAAALTDNVTLVTSTGLDNVSLGSGDDVVTYLANTGGVDTINGGDGNDTLKLLSTPTADGKLGGIAGFERIELIAGSKLDLTGYGNGAEVVVLSRAGSVIGSSSSDTIRGAAGGDILDGGAGGSDLLEGGAGNDLLVARTGNDTLTGGAGKDLFQIDYAAFGPAASGTDPTSPQRITISDLTSDDALRLININGQTIDLKTLLVGPSAPLGPLGDLLGSPTNPLPLLDYNTAYAAATLLLNAGQGTPTTVSGTAPKSFNSVYLFDQGAPSQASPVPTAGNGYLFIDIDPPVQGGMGLPTAATIDVVIQLVGFVPLVLQPPG